MASEVLSAWCERLTGWDTAEGALERSRGELTQVQEWEWPPVTVNLRMADDREPARLEETYRLSVLLVDIHRQSAFKLTRVIDQHASSAAATPLRGDEECLHVSAGQPEKANWLVTLRAQDP